MQKKSLLRLGLTGIVLGASVLLLSTDSPTNVPAPVKAKKPTCCKKIKEQTCPGKKESSAPGEIMLENLSQQFISTTVFFY